MASNVLADRLDRLQAQGIIRAKPYSAHQDRFEYRLTRKGLDLYPVLLALLQWGDRWYADAKGPPLLLTHQNCGHALRLSSGGERLPFGQCSRAPSLISLPIDEVMF